MVFLNGEPFAVSEKGHKAIELLIEAAGEYVSLSENGIKTRDVESLPKQIYQLIECDPGAGSRLKT